MPAETYKAHRRSAAVVAIAVAALASTVAHSFPTFQPSQSQQSQHIQCKPTGCNNELCVPVGESSSSLRVTTCAVKPEHKCFKSAVCEAQKSNGKCGWTLTKEFNACVAKARKVEEGDVEKELDMAKRGLWEHRWYGSAAPAGRKEEKKKNGGSKEGASVGSTQQEKKQNGQKNQKVEVEMADLARKPPSTSQSAQPDSETNEDENNFTDSEDGDSSVGYISDDSDEDDRAMIRNLAKRNSFLAEKEAALRPAARTQTSTMTYAYNAAPTQTAPASPFLWNFDIDSDDDDISEMSYAHMDIEGIEGSDSDMSDGDDDNRFGMWARLKRVKRSGGSSGRYQTKTKEIEMATLTKTAALAPTPSSQPRNGNDDDWSSIGSASDSDENDIRVIRGLRVSKRGLLDWFGLGAKPSASQTATTAVPSPTPSSTPSQQLESDSDSDDEDANFYYDSDSDDKESSVGYVTDSDEEDRLRMIETLKRVKRSNVLESRTFPSPSKQQTQQQNQQSAQQAKQILSPDFISKLVKHAEEKASNAREGNAAVHEGAVEWFRKVGTERGRKIIKPLEVKDGVKQGHEELRKA
ncbi:hypothetical protein HK102_000587 [Quaeritorhiza haematococci]|nr:hypothetical protein HK102_000587 [Quaeritorhiza haematococci]